MRKLALVAVLLISACSDDDSGDPNSYVSVNDYATVGKASYCSYLTRCGFFPDQASCTGANLNLPTQLRLAPETIAAIRAGHILYNGNNAKACLDSFANATCDKTDEAGRVLPLACYELFRGAVDADGECFQDAECISGDCQILVADETCAAGKCVGNTPPPAIMLPRNGENCSPSLGCVAGYACSQSTFMCEPLHGMGEDCVTTAECAFGLGCAGVPRTCRPLPATGQPCPDGECRDDGTRCTTSGCVALGLPGATCQSSTECSNYYTCNFTTTKCERSPVTGEPCNSGGSRCFDASFCDSSTLMCVPYRGAGEICSSSLQCASGECDFNTQECVEPTTCF